MAFDITTWKENVKTRFSQWQPQTAVNSLYLTLAAAAFWPVAAAYQQGEVAAVFALGQLLAGVGGNLLANAVQAVKDEADTAVHLQQMVQEKPAVTAEIDVLLESLDVIAQAQVNLNQADREWFAQTLRQELAQLGNLSRFTATLTEGAALASGENARAAAARAVIVDGDVDGSIITGNQNRVVEAEQYIENMYQGDDPAAKQESVHQRYLKRLLHYCNVLPLAALGGSEGLHQEISLEQVYIDLDTLTRIPLEKEARDEEGRLNLTKQPDDRPQTVLEATTQERQLVLLGDPGSGKSTFVRQLAARLAAAELGVREPLAEWEPLLPLLTTLRDLAQHLSPLQLEGLTEEKRQQRLLTAVRRQWREDCANMGAAELADTLEDGLLDGQILLIFDGLDEVAEGLRGRVREAVKAVRDSYSHQLRILVTCRIRSYGGEAVLPGFASETLAPFDEAKISGFVTAWYQAQVGLGRVKPGEADEKTADLQQAIASAGLQELAQNPMLLTTMTIIHQQDTRLPNERVRLYTRAVDVLLHRWQDRKKLQVSAALTAVLNDPSRLRSLLNRLAYKAHQKQEREGAGADLSRWDILQLLEDSRYLGDLTLAAEFLDYVDQRAGLLVGQGGQAAGQKPNTYSFPHRTFQEYLAGCYMVTGRTPSRTYRQHMGSSDYWYLAAELGSEQLLYNNDQGQTAFLDLAYDLCPAAEPEQAADWRGVVWSGRMATLLPKEVIAADDGRPDGGRAYLNRLQPRLQIALRQPGVTLRWGERAAAGRSLAQLGDERPGIRDIEQMPLCYVPPGPFYMGSREEDVEAQKNEQPQHEVNLDYGYWLGQYPITQAHYAAFLESGGYQERSYWEEAIQEKYWQPGQFQGRLDEEARQRPYNFGEPFSLANHPVVGITWYEAMAFVRWLTRQWQAADILPSGWQVTLPSEAEWEKGGRGGQQIPTLPICFPAETLPDWSPTLSLAENPFPRRSFPWEEDTIEPDKANYGKGGINSSSAVGCFSDGRSLYGCEEMMGNVFEWTRSRFAGYKYDPADGREEYQNEPYVLRGGSFWTEERYARCSARGGLNPNLRLDDRGFRVVVVPIFPTSDL